MKTTAISIFVFLCLQISAKAIGHELSLLHLNNEIDVILIDPGHGGKDSGCTGHSLMEKEVALELAFKVGQLITVNYPHIEVRYTRTTDVFIPLHERVKMANEDDVDLFISLHCNAVGSKAANGIETYVMGIETSEENMAIAKRENEVILMEDLSEYDPYTDEGHIMLAMMQQQTLEKSIQLAGFVQSKCAGETTFRDRGVKQAGFVVLRKVVVPSILVEAGFITNPDDAARLKEESEQNKIALSVVSGVGKYIAYYQSQ
ncbi:N-acetylmuramoyl-L-alanine amidase family protein [Portibacter marinus]|uniref:N-acetylmuramoyl-L-alanine amidase family protein n=1 Tax=Portibacter marinus TaxID=2898660 RepID=UPI001F1FCB4D|nr:N-acetylmuramoyl-L-alanine amidase [Portibacter marinus]